MTKDMKQVIGLIVLMILLFILICGVAKVLEYEKEITCPKCGYVIIYKQ